MMVPGRPPRQKPTGSSFLIARWKFLDNIIKRTEPLTPDVRVRLSSAVQTAMICLMQIQPETCDEFVQAWRQDLAVMGRQPDIGSHGPVG